MSRTQKVSIAFDKNALAAAKAKAAAHGLSLSALLMKLLSEHFEREARFESMGQFLAEHAPKFRATEQQLDAVRAELKAPLKPIRPRRRRRAA